MFYKYNIYLHIMANCIQLNAFGRHANTYACFHFLNENKYSIQTKIVQIYSVLNRCA